jgi:hypothetical protein
MMLLEMKELEKNMCMSEITQSEGELQLGEFSGGAV